MISENIDLAQVMIYLFWIFFACLVIYLRREDRREGYPLESDTMVGKLHKPSLIFFPAPKTFALPHGGSLRTVPTGLADTRPIAAQPIARWPGAPLQPTDAMPLTSGVGPGAWAERSDTPDMTFENHTKIVPLRVAPAYAPASDGPDPRGYTVIGLDRAIAGTVTDLWIDRSECVLRYLEVTLADGASAGKATAGTPTRMGAGFEAKADPRPANVSSLTGNGVTSAMPTEAAGGAIVGAPATGGTVVTAVATATPTRAGTVLVPVTFANIHRRRRTVTIKAVLGSQLGMVPRPASADQITLLEEDKVAAFFGAGMLYATKNRAEPLL